MAAETLKNGGRRPTDVTAAVVHSLAPDVLYGIRIPPLPPSEIPIEHPDLEKFPIPEAYPWLRVQRAIADTLESVSGVRMTVAIPPPNVGSEIGADFSTSTHTLSNFHPGQKPGNIARSMVEAIGPGSIEHIAGVEAHPRGFINFELDKATFSRGVLGTIEDMGGEYGNQNIGDGKVVVMDVSSPNVAKQMSVGHLRSTVIGESLARIYRAGGFTVIRDNHIGDWGTQFGMLGHAVDLWGDEIDRQMPSADPVRKLQALYVRINQEVSRQKEEHLAKLREDHPELDERALGKMAFSSLEQKGREWFSRLEKGDPQARALLETVTAQSFAEFQRVYELLGTGYEYFLGESFYQGMLSDVINAFEESGVAQRDESGALSVEFPEEAHLPKLVVQKSDGSSLYQTREMATFIARTSWFNPDKIIYVVGADQIDYFRQTFAAFSMLSQGQGPALEHVYFGLMSLSGTGKMSSRRGDIVFLENVLEEAIAKARSKLAESNQSLGPEEIETTARQIGVGAVIYMDLRQSRKRNITFDLGEALSFEGNSSPYIQYAHARVKSLERKAKQLGIKIDRDIDPGFSLPTEKELVKGLAQFPDAIAKAIETNEPSVVAAYTYNLAETFSRFYNEAPVISEEDPERKNTRLRLTQATAQVIKNGLYLLGIETPEKM